MSKKLDMVVRIILSWIFLGFGIYRIILIRPPNGGAYGWIEILFQSMLAIVVIVSVLVIWIIPRKSGKDGEG